MPSEQNKKALVAAKRALYERANVNIDFNTLKVVWYNYTLGNQKFLLMSPVVDDLYLEVTYNNHTDEYYVDIYQKFSNSKYDSNIL